MEPSFWLERWQRNETGFHEGRPNALLVEHWASLGAGGRVLVPLCGKSRDLVWLRAQGHEVVGVELSRLAAEQFFAELGLVSAMTPRGLAAGGIEILVGDIFALGAIGPVSAVYDRAALVAMPPAMRQAYAEQVMALSGGAPQLVITFDYDQAVMDGPPFAVPEAVVRELYGARYQVECAAKQDVPGGLKGVCPASEAVWILQLTGRSHELSGTR